MSEETVSVAVTAAHIQMGRIHEAAVSLLHCRRHLSMLAQGGREEDREELRAMVEDLEEMRQRLVRREAELDAEALEDSE